MKAGSFDRTPSAGTIAPYPTGNVIDSIVFAFTFCAKVNFTIPLPSPCVQTTDPIEPAGTVVLIVVVLGKLVFRAKRGNARVIKSPWAKPPGLVDLIVSVISAGKLVLVPAAKESARSENSAVDAGELATGAASIPEVAVDCTRTVISELSDCEPPAGSLRPADVGIWISMVVPDCTAALAVNLRRESVDAHEAEVNCVVLTRREVTVKHCTENVEGNDDEVKCASLISMTEPPPMSRPWGGRKGE